MAKISTGSWVEKKQLILLQNVVKHKIITHTKTTLHYMCKLLYTNLRCKDVCPPNLLFTYFTVGSMVFIRQLQGNNKKLNTKNATQIFLVSRLWMLNYFL